MMSKIYRYSIVLLITAGLSCSKSTSLDYGGGGGGGDSGLVSIAYLKSLCSNYPVMISGDIYIEGVVVSSDIQGGFYKSLIIEDASAGIEVRLDRERLFSHFKHGSKVKIRCNSLAIGLYGRSPQLGSYSVVNATVTVGRISDGEIDSRVKILSDATQRPHAHPLTFAALTPRYVNCLVCFDDVAFIDSEVGGRWSEEDTDTNRTLVDSQGNRLSVRVSRHCTFASERIPSGSGSVEGVLSYFNDSYQLKIFDIRHVDFD